MTATRTFTETTTVTEVEPDRYAASLDESWCLGGRAHGGLLMALAGRAAAARAQRPHVISASATFVATAAPGPVLVETEVLRAGRSMTQVHARVVRNGEVCVDAIAIVGDVPLDSTPYWTGQAVPRPGTESLDACTRLPGRNPLGVPIPMWDRVDLRVEPSTSGYQRGEPTGAGEVRGWLALPDDADFDSMSLLFALDVLPPATFDIELSGWVPTLSLSAYIRAIPVPGPLRLSQGAGFIEAGRVDQWCCAWDSAGRLVAQATQLAGIRLG